MPPTDTEEVGEIDIEVVYALPERQALVRVRLPTGSTVDAAIAAARLAEAFNADELTVAEVGVWGRIVNRQERLSHGDRVELYRPLKIDPREARRQLAEAGRTMLGREKARN